MTIESLLEKILDFDGDNNRIDGLDDFAESSLNADTKLDEMIIDDICQQCNIDCKISDDHGKLKMTLTDKSLEYESTNTITLIKPHIDELPVELLDYASKNSIQIIELNFQRSHLIIGESHKHGNLWNFEIHANCPILEIHANSLNNVSIYMNPLLKYKSHGLSPIVYDAGLIINSLLDRPAAITNSIIHANDCYVKIDLYDSHLDLSNSTIVAEQLVCNFYDHKNICKFIEDLIDLNIFGTKYIGSDTNDHPIINDNIKNLQGYDILESLKLNALSSIGTISLHQLVFEADYDNNYDVAFTKGTLFGEKVKRLKRVPKTKWYVTNKA